MRLLQGVFVLTFVGGLLADGVPPPECPPNEHYTENDTTCVRTCANRDDPVCYDCKPTTGCICHKDLVRKNDDGTGPCISVDNCPPRCDKNSTRNECGSACPPTCIDADDSKPCIEICVDRCECNHGFILTDDKGVCIDPHDCPGGSPCCGENKTWSDCRNDCLINYCPQDDCRVLPQCMPQYPCDGGCVCSPEHLMVSPSDRRCVSPCDCPPVECTRPNEVWSCDAPSCLPERCEERDIPCDWPVPGRPRCICKPGYFRNHEDKCVPERECPPLVCKEDNNATYWTCPNPCEPTCCEPDTDVKCDNPPVGPGCECNDGFLLNDNGQCVSPCDCPGGSPYCGPNKTYTSCKSHCQSDYCPTKPHEENEDCHPTGPCPASGCVCESGYLMLNDGSQDCVLPQDCPPVPCSENEVWNPCPPDPESEKCENMFSECPPPSEPGRPRCVCAPGHFRNQNGDCVSADQCPCPIPDRCKKTCARPDPHNCNYLPAPCNMDCCNCQEGYVLLDVNGPCVKIEDCPTNLGCNDDPNAVIKQCPNPCPPTCKNVNPGICLALCIKAGCECLPGFLVNQTGQCVHPNDCPGGDPCGKHSHYVPCQVDCLSDYCPKDDCRDVIVCDPPETGGPGCVCDKNYKKKSVDNPKCVPGHKCPRVHCTRRNEIWHPCPSPCLVEKCEDWHNPKDCCEPSEWTCEPRCICKKNHYRDSNGTCVPARKCPCF